jgi:hypothetical protein
VIFTLDGDQGSVCPALNSRSEVGAIVLGKQESTD